ncbi:alginate regulatory protein [Clostridia bacterium]|nr:alginate regulatory protein [Clostridia bacterium]
MLFSSVSFLFYFLPMVLIINFAVPQRYRNGILLAASLFFYAWGEPVYILLMLFSIVFNYLAGSRIQGRLSLALAVAVNLALLGFFKYADFIIWNINSITGLKISTMGLPLPIGISFYTFQAVSYLVDVRRGNVGRQHSLVNFGAYISLFPQLIAGPIVRLNSIEEQLCSRSVSVESFASGVRKFVCGLGKKVILANNIGILWEQVSGIPGSELTVSGAWLGALAFTFQIYFDFSGYSDMAIGLGRMLGFTFPVNFNYPYTAGSITEFWRRWHMSLSSFFRDYVYIPLGGNRRGLVRQLRNIILVWFLTGFWHGASWNFALWGLYFGVLLILEKLFLLNFLGRLPSFVGRVYTLVLVMISWVLFASESLSGAVGYVQGMFGWAGGGFISDQTLYLLRNNFVLIIILCIGSTGLPLRLGMVTPEHGGTRVRALLECIWFLGLTLVSVAYLISSTFNPFLYFRF